MGYPSRSTITLNQSALDVGLILLRVLAGTTFIPLCLSFRMAYALKRRIKSADTTKACEGRSPSELPESRKARDSAHKTTSVDVGSGALQALNPVKRESVICQYAIYYLIS
jgi:hypothetical protein